MGIPAKLHWRLVQVISELILFLAMLFAALILIDVYMLTFGGVAPGDLMYMHEAQSRRDLALQLSLILAVGGVALSVRYKALRNLTH